MECTTWFLAVDGDAQTIGELRRSFADGAAPDAGILHDYFAGKGQKVNLPDGFGFDQFESSVAAVDASFISGSTVARDFLIPLSRSVRYVIGTISNDEDGPTQRFAYIDGKKSSRDEVVAAMQRVATPEQLGSLGRQLLKQAAAASDPKLSVIVAISKKQPLAAIVALLQAGADPDAFDSYGDSGLNHAIKRRDGALLECLLAHGASLSKRWKKNQSRPSYLAKACIHGPGRAAALLIAHGADAAARDSYFERYPVELAIESNHSDVVEVLLAHGAPTSGVADMGSLPAFLLSRFGDYGKVARKLDILRLLARDPNCLADIRDNRAAYAAMATRNYALGIQKNDKDSAAVAKIVAFIESA